MLIRLRNSWTLVKASGRVLTQDPELLVFPALSGLALAVVGASFFGAGLLTDLQSSVASDGGSALSGILAVLFYVVSYTVIFFFNSALVGAALIRLDGGDPTIGDGFRIATERIGTILGYAVLAATVGMVIRMIAERVGVLGRLLTGLAGSAWSVATYLAVPVLVSKDVDPLEAVKESAALFRRTWGEQVAGSASIALVFVPVFILIAIVGVLGIIGAASISPALAIAAVASLIGAILLASLVSSALSTVYSAALYRYATTGEAPAGFDAGTLRGAFHPKR